MRVCVMSERVHVYVCPHVYVLVFECMFVWGYVRACVRACVRVCLHTYMFGSIISELYIAAMHVMIACYKLMAGNFRKRYTCEQIILLSERPWCFLL